MYLTRVEVERRGESKQLIVVLHAFGQTPESLRSVMQAIRSEKRLSDADLLSPQYPAGPLSNADPLLIADELSSLFDGAVASHRDSVGRDYEEILLVGHSLGGLLLRKAYVLARGETEEIVGSRSRPRAWAGRVSRIVLLAGINRGWSLSPKPRHMLMARWLTLRLALWITAPLPVCRLIRSARRGAPFVANLRVQWLRLVESGSPPPLTVQVLGNKDDVVSIEDSADVATARRFVFLRVPSTSHLDAIDFTGPVGSIRRDALLKSLVTPENDLSSDLVPSLQPNVGVEQVVFIMHGIRDRGHWTDDMAEVVERRARVRGLQVVVCISSYGYFPMGAFLLLNRRQQQVRWFVDQYTEHLARYPRAAFHFIGHSNGTYLLASALKHYSSCVFQRVIFAGSVVRTDYPWRHLIASNRVAGVRNFVGSSDLIVGVFPGFFEFLGVSDLGSAGHNGFRDSAAKAGAFEFLRGGHAAFLPRNFEAREELFVSIADYVLAGEVRSVPSLKVEYQNWLVVWLSKFNWLVWATLLVAILASGVVLVQSVKELIVFVAVLIVLLRCL